jgi:hypothetical protein
VERAGDALLTYESTDPARAENGPGSEQFIDRRMSAPSLSLAG